MKIGFEKTEYFDFYFKYPFNKNALELCYSLRKTYGVKEFNFHEGKWRFKDPSIVFIIQTAYPDIEIDREVNEEISIQEDILKGNIRMEKEADRIKNATESSTKIEGIKADLRNYQLLAVDFFLNNNGRGILADDMGTGKTLQSLSYLVKAKHKRTLVICPASVKFSWEDEVIKWTNLIPYVVDSKTNFKDIPYETDVVIINYDILKKHLKPLLSIPWDCMICDEAHLVKSPSATRSKAVKMISRKIKCILMLSGTPLLSRPIELFNLLHIIDMKSWSDYYDFARKYCDGKMGRYGFEAKGATNLDELRRTISRYFLRRTKDQILKELPPKVRIEVPIKLTGESKIAYDKVSDEFVKFLRENKGKRDKEILKTLNAERLTKINYLRQTLTLGKLDVVRELINSIIDSGQKVLVFSVFNEPLEILRDEYADSVMITGDVDVAERGPLVKKFQDDPKSKVFFGGVKSSGVGITLTAASNVIFIDYSWNPADMNQAEDRMHRMGQKAKSVNIYQVTARGTIDEFMIKLLSRKQKIFNVLIDADKIEREEQGSVNELIQMIEETN